MRAPVSWTYGTYLITPDELQDNLFNLHFVKIICFYNSVVKTSDNVTIDEL